MEYSLKKLFNRGYGFFFFFFFVVKDSILLPQQILLLKLFQYISEKKSKILFKYLFNFFVP